MKRISVISEDGHLVGSKEVEDDAVLSPTEADIDPGDLPLDGTYKWDGNAFIPLGHGIPLKVKRPPIPDTYAMYLAIKKVHSEFGLGQQVVDWLDWYEANLKLRDEERVLGDRRRAARATAIGRR